MQVATRLWEFVDTNPDLDHRMSSIMAIGKDNFICFTLCCRLYVGKNIRARHSRGTRSSCTIANINSITLDGSNATARDESEIIQYWEWTVLLAFTTLLRHSRSLFG